MFRKLFFVFTILLLTTSAFANGNFPSVATNSVDVECPVACPCCDDLTGGLLSDIDYYNQMLEEYDKDFLSWGFRWSSIKTMLDEKASGAARSQSPIDAISRQGFEDYDEQYAESQETEEIMQGIFDEGDEISSELADTNQDLQDTLNEILACDCITGCDTGIRSLLNRLQSDAETKIPELRKQNGLYKLNALAAGFNFSQESADRADQAKQAAKDALKQFSPIDPKPMEILEDCCKKGVDECVSDILGGERHYALDWLVDGWAVDASLTGTDTATGNFGELTLTNNTGERIGWVIPEGTILYPGTGDTQRMMVTERLSGILEPGQTVTVNPEGVCLDAGLFPFSSGIADMDLTFGGLFPSTPTINIPSVREILDNIASIVPDIPDIGSLIPDFGSMYSTPEDPGFSFSDFMPSFTEIFEDAIWLEYLMDFLSVPSFAELAESWIGSEDYTPTGLPLEMEISTFMQWLTWGVTDGFDEEDGYDRISEQVEESGGTQTPEQIGQLNTSIWGNVDLVQKRARSQVQGASQGMPSPIGKHKDDKQEIRISVLDTLGAMLDFSTEVNAEEMPSKKVAFKQALEAVKYSSYILSMIQNLVFDIEKIAKLSYTSEIAAISEGKTKAIRTRLTKVIKDLKKAKVKFSKDKKLTAEDLVKVKEAKVALISKGSDFDNVFGAIRAQINKSYKAWDKKYIKLVKKGNKAKEKGKEFESALDREQLKFVKVFTRVKLYYNLLGKLYK